MSSRPNVVLIMTDQQRVDLAAREGYPLDTTPFLDGLARRGTWFDRAYTPTPLCAPARVSLLTGRYPSATRVRENQGTDHATYERDLFDVMREHGYATALVGKNHSHIQTERLDYASRYMHTGGLEANRSRQEQAFDRWLHNLHHRVSLEPTPFPLECQAPYRIVTQAQGWIASIDGAPFCLWLSFPEPHNPYQAPEPYFSRFPPDSLPPLTAGEAVLANKSYPWRYLRDIGERAHPDYAASIPRARANYHGMLRLIDDQVARFLAYLDAHGLRDNTLLVVMSDHGDFVGEYGLTRKGAEMPEVLMRVPLSFTGPGIRANAAPHAAFVSLVDVFPTLCDGMNIPLPAGVQGRSLWPLLTGQTYPAAEFTSVYAEQGVGGRHFTPDDTREEWPGLTIQEEWRAFDELNACTQSGTLRMVRKGDWKLLLDMQGRGQLYDLAADPFELNNIYGGVALAGVQAELLAELAGWMMRVQDPLPVPRRGYRRKTDPRNYWTPYRDDAPPG
ncbi:MAG: sulfatase family protein [Thermomicrobiales bacterium]